MSRLSELLQTLTNTADPRVTQACALCGSNPSESSAARDCELKTQNILAGTQRLAEMYAQESASLARRLADAVEDNEKKDRELAELRAQNQEFLHRRAELEMVMAELVHARDSLVKFSSR